jgi:hypothetical protein
VTAATTVEERIASHDQGGTLLDRVLAAATRNMTAPNGEPFEVEVDGDHLLGEAVATYRLGSTVLGVRTFRVAARSRIVSLLGFELPTWWFDGTSIHEQFVENLSVEDLSTDPAEGTAGHGRGCLLSAVLTGPRSGAWTPYFEWAPGMGNANAAALAAAVETITPPPSDADRTGEAVWGGSDLPERVKLLAGPDPRREDGQGTWRHLVGSTTPASLVAALDGLHLGLGHTVFAHIGAWYGESAVPQDRHDAPAST